MYFNYVASPERDPFSKHSVYFSIFARLFNKHLYSGAGKVIGNLM